MRVMFPDIDDGIELVRHGNLDRTSQEQKCPLTVLITHSLPLSRQLNTSRDDS